MSLKGLLEDASEVGNWIVNTVSGNPGTPTNPNDPNWDYQANRPKTSKTKLDPEFGKPKKSLTTIKPREFKEFYEEPPEFKPWSAGAGMSLTEKPQTLEKLKDYALSEEESPWASAQISKQNTLYNKNLTGLEQRAESSSQEAARSMGRTGGVRSGGVSRIGDLAQKQYLQQHQKLKGFTDENIDSIREIDEREKQSIRQALPALELASLAPKEFQINTMLEDLANERSEGLRKFGESMDIQGRTKLGQAYAKK